MMDPLEICFLELCAVRDLLAAEQRVNAHLRAMLLQARRLTSALTQADGHAEPTDGED